MKRSITVLIVVAVAIVTFLFLRRSNEKIFVSKEQPTIEMTNANVPNPQSVVFATPVSSNIQNAEDINATSVPVQIVGKTPQQVIAEKNSESQDFYGEVIDQSKRPVSDVDVSGTLIIETDNGFTSESYATKTGLDGSFEFTGLHGTDLNVKIKKEGYVMGERGEGYHAPAGGKSSPNNRALFVMWKLHGAEPLTGSSIDVKIPHDGTPVTFEIATGQQSPNGDFRVTLSQYPLQIKKGWERFDWSVKVDILNGGLVEENDPYPYWAPTNGYQPSFEFSESTNSVKWLGGLQKNFYIETARGQYGIMQFKIFPGRSPTGLEVNFTINPSGSQNLEPMPERQSP